VDALNERNILDFTDNLVFAATSNHLSQPQRSLLLACGSEVRQSYDQIAQHCGYSPHYLRKHIGPQFWQLLSAVLGEKVNKVNAWHVLERHWRQQAQQTPLPHPISPAPSEQSPVHPLNHGASTPWQAPPRVDWGEATNVEFFYGRQQELAQLQHWVTTDRCRLVGLFGVGGMGKTHVSLKLAQQLTTNPQDCPFQFVIWRSLRNTPPLVDLLADLLQFLNPQLMALPAAVDTRLSQLVDCLHATRCLLIFDNFESILRSGSYAGHYRDGYEPYGQLLHRVGETTHQSCLMLTSREKPKEFALLEGHRLPVRSLGLKGLQVEDGRHIFQLKGIQTLAGSEETDLIQRYSGNPLALKIVAATIQDLFDGNIRTFLNQEATVIGGIDELLTQQFERLSPLEKTILYWLAIAREPIALETLRYDMVAAIPQRQILEALQSLGQRSLVERNQALFSLQPVVMEYVGDRLIAQVCADLSRRVPAAVTVTVDPDPPPTDSPIPKSVRLPPDLRPPAVPHLATSLLKTHSLLKAEAKDYVREAQIRVILTPLVDQLLAQFTTQPQLEHQLKQLLEWQRSHFPSEPGYLAGNLLNLLRHLQADLTGLDCSHLTVWQAYLEGAHLYQVNFSSADLSRSVLSETFASTLSLAFSPNGELLATATTDNEICLWQVADGRKVMVCQGHTGWVHSVAFSPCGTLLASGSEDETIRLWDIQTGQCVATLEGHTNWVWSVTFSPDGSTLASGSNDHTIRVWQVKTGQCLQVLRGHSGWVWSVAFSPDGSLLASGSTDHSVRLWEMPTGTCVGLLEGHGNWVQAVGFSPIASSDQGFWLASGSHDHTIRLWDVKTGECLKVLEGHRNWVQSLAFSPQSGDARGTPLLASSSNDQTVKLWNFSSGQCLRTLKSASQDIWSIAFTPDGLTIASGGSDQMVNLWDVQTGYCLRTLQGYNGGILSASFSPDGSLLATGGSDRTIRLWSMHAGQPIGVLEGHTSWVRSVAFSPGGQMLASGGSDHTIRLWNPVTGQWLKTLYGHASWVRSVAFSRDGRSLVSGSTDHTVRLWDTHTGQCLKILAGHTHWVRCVAVHPTLPLIASSGDDQTIRLWDSLTGACLKVLKGHSTGIWSLAFSGDGRHLASGGDDQVLLLWDLPTGSCLKTLKGHTDWIQSVAFSPDGRILASGSNDQTIRLWDVETGVCLNTLHGHTNRIWVVGFSPMAVHTPPLTAALLVSGGEDEAIYCWAIPSGQCIKSLKVTRPYEAMNIQGVKGLTNAQRRTLFLLGAVS
jgi:WD40 repeat protein